MIAEFSRLPNTARGGRPIDHTAAPFLTARVTVAGGGFHWEEKAMQTAGPNELGYANTAPRGMEFAKDWQSRGKIAEPAVVGAIIDLGFCLDLLTSTGIATVKSAHEDLVAYAKKADKPLPKNRLGPDELLRDLDCAVINHLHKVRDALGLTA
jgi:hypothetical protein